MVKESSANVWLIAGSILALIISPLIVLLSGDASAYALVLFPVTLILWLLTRLSIKSMGIMWGNVRAYLLAFIYPFFVMGLTFIIVMLFGGIEATDFSLSDAAWQILNMFLISFLLGMLTEEGFFRGWLWGMLELRSNNKWFMLIWSSGLFCIWHFAVNFVMPNESLSAFSIPVYLGNILLLGFNMGLLRMASGSIIIPSISHALWNGLLYNLFGFATYTGALQISSYQIFDPERGLLGLALNLIAAIILWKFAAAKRKIELP